MDSADEPRARFPRPAKRGEGGTQRAQRDAGPRKRGEGNALLPFARPELEAEVESAMDSLGDPDDAFRYHHSYLMAVATRR